MQEVCTTLDTQLGAQIKSESPLNSLKMGPTPPQVLNDTFKESPIQTCDKGAESQYWMSNESGFINSQPSMAEFLTHLSPDNSKMGQQGYPIVSPDGVDGVPEYPWMKEKKTSRKNNSQGELVKLFYLLCYFALRNL